MAAIWATATRENETLGSIMALAYGEAMTPGQFVDSPSARYRLIFQTDGNLVLLHLPGTVLWATATEGQGADSVQMQTDGNLVVYAGATPLWESETTGNLGAYLVLQNDGNLVIYTYGGIENLAVVTPRPNWADGLTETLTWLTSVTESPMAVEQRMGLRLSPRQMWEVGYTLWGPPRTHLDLLTMASAGSPLYLPLWQDPNRTAAPAYPGGKTIYVDAAYTGLLDCRLAVLLGDDLFTSEVVEIFEHGDTALVLIAGLQRYWPAGSRIYPCKKVKVETQLSGNRHADRAYVAKARFISLEPNDSLATATLGTFNGSYVLEDDPNDVAALTHAYERKMFTLDQNTGLQQISDVSGFTHQSHAWFAKGRAAHWRLRGLFYALQGRRVPVWLPSNFADFDLMEPIDATDTALTVRRCGYTDFGGPFPHRQHILIYLHDGTRFYRKIVAAAISADGELEVLGFDTALGRSVAIDDVRRISFLTYSRLDQDAVEFVHHTDTKGVTTVNAVFRTDPGIGAPPPTWPAVLFSAATAEDLLPMHRAVYIDPTSLGAWNQVPSGAVSTPVGMCSVFVRGVTEFGAFNDAVNIASVHGSVFPNNAFLTVGFQNTGSGPSDWGLRRVFIGFMNAAGNQGMFCYSTATLPRWNDLDWHHFIIAWDISSETPAVTVWLDRVPYACTLDPLSVFGGGLVHTIDYTQVTGGHFLGTTGVAVKGLNGLGAELWLAPGQMLDLSNPANLAKFVDSGLHAVELGGDGSIPTGTAPMVYFSGPAANGIEGYANVPTTELFTYNRGTGGGTITSFSAPAGGGIATVENLMIPVPPFSVPVNEPLDPFA